MSIEPIKHNPEALSKFMGLQIYAFTSKQSQTSFDFLGGNNRKILMLIDESAIEYFSTEAEDMFVKLLAAVKLSMQDIAVVNLSKNAGATWHELQKQFTPEKIILWGVDPAFTGNTATKYNYANNLLYADRIEAISKDVELKKNLWPELQKMFL